MTLQPAAQRTVATSEVETATREYYAYNGRGVTLGRRVNSDDDDFRTLVIERTAGGLPQQIGSRTLTYSADRRLIEVQNPAGCLRVIATTPTGSVSANKIRCAVRPTISTPGNNW